MILIIFDELSTERTRDLPKSTVADHMQLKISSFGRIVRGAQQVKLCKNANKSLRKIQNRLVQVQRIKKRANAYQTER